MARFLANENMPAEAVRAAQGAGIDIVWVRDTMPGADDDAVLATAVSEGQVVVTFDKDFGEMVFNLGRSASPALCYSDRACDLRPSSPSSPSPC